MTDHMGRTLADAIKAAAKLKDELPHIVQVYPSDHDTIIMAAEIERLREALEIWIFHHQRAIGEKPDVARAYAKAWMFRNANGEEPE